MGTADTKQKKRRRREYTGTAKTAEILSQHANTVSAVNLVEKGTSNRSSGGGGGAGGGGGGGGGGSGRHGVTTVQLCNANGCLPAWSAT